MERIFHSLQVGRIQEAQEAQPDVPLGTAEQFLLTLASVGGLEARLRLWAFKMEFDVIEREVIKIKCAILFFKKGISYIEHRYVVPMFGLSYELSSRTPEGKLYLNYGLAKFRCDFWTCNEAFILGFFLKNVAKPVDFINPMMVTCSKTTILCYKTEIA